MFSSPSPVRAPEPQSNISAESEWPFLEWLLTGFGTQVTADKTGGETVDFCIGLLDRIPVAVLPLPKKLGFLCNNLGKR